MKWELVDNKNVKFTPSNREGLIWELLVTYIDENNAHRLIGKIIDKEFVNNAHNDYLYKMVWAEGGFLFFRTTQKAGEE